MKFEEPIAKVILFENDDVIVTSGCDYPSAVAEFDSEKCDGVLQAVSKPFGV